MTQDAGNAEFHSSNTIIHKEVGTVNGAPCRVSIVSLQDLTTIWHGSESQLQWKCPFGLPPWLNVWWEVFSGDAEPMPVVVRQGEAIIGAAPLMVYGKTVRFMGSPDVCDYFDCIVAPGKERTFFTSLFGHIAELGFPEIDLGPLRPDGAVLKLCSERRTSDSPEWSIQEAGSLAELELPSTWDQFLGSLDGKQRHEVRRKLRRLHAEGGVRFRKVDTPAEVPEAVELFLRLFTMNREDKAAFMTSRMASFFRALSNALTVEGMLKLFFLDVKGQPAASVFCFDHLGTRYLYNNGYDSTYQDLSVGILSKVLSLKAAIDEGLHTYNFLKGDEAYKYRLGGEEIPLWRCHGELR
jgi:CelD/BcsL family acetyltransferase involved in cellulose biosynthesis